MNWPKLQAVIGVSLALLFITGCAVYKVGSELSAPAQRKVGTAPPDLNAVDVQIGGVKGWFVSAGEKAACILLMHGVGADRRSMVERARILRRSGYSSLLFDFQAHGESEGEKITFGYLEARNAKAAAAFLRMESGCPRIAAIGQSLGGAAALLGETPIDVDALVLESVYPTIEEAVTDRLRMRVGGMGSIFSPLLIWQLEPRLGVKPEDLRPISRIGGFRHPILVASGSEDRHTTIDEARRLFAVANEPKEFWEVPGAAHVDLQRFAPEAYGEKVLGFLSRYLRRSEQNAIPDSDPLRPRIDP